MAAAYLRAQSVAPPAFCSKIAFETRQIARRRMNASRKIPATVASAFDTAGNPQRVYQCSACGLWHITHAK